ncbi:hypothetical protein LAZ67_1004315 [Cordylochernes scorpioides]|uniref:Uncharacterized protein n=1 Tax=Cordylochernes scorpioides TaxID=51811 RepID=A0ABY6JXK2_9ARAC|nr:hypothetical protein LAZ67_1004315 [Cordylochernes scorpioides]
MEAPLKDCTTLEQRAVIRFWNAEGIQTSQICQRMKNIYEQNPGPRPTRQTTLESCKEGDIRQLIGAISNKMDNWGDKLISGIEQNPGPRPTRQTTLESCMEGDIRQLIGAISNKMDNWGDKLETRLLSIEQGVDKLNRRIQQLENTMENTVKSVSKNSERIQEIEKRIDFTEMKMRESNLIFYGVEKKENETSDESLAKIKQIITDNMQISENINILKCHRLSKRPSAPLLVEIPKYEDRIKLFRNAFKLKQLRIYINKDYTLKVREQRRLLINKRKELLAKGISSRLRDSKLIVGSTVYQVINDKIMSSEGTEI